MWPTNRIELPGGHWAVVHAELPEGVAVQIRRLRLKVLAAVTADGAKTDPGERISLVAPPVLERYEADARSARVLGCVTGWCWQAPVDAAGVALLPAEFIDDLRAGIEAVHGLPRTADEVRRVSSRLAAALLSGGQVPVELEEAWRCFWMARWGLIRPPSYQELLSWPARLVKELETVALTVAEVREARQALE